LRNGALIAAPSRESGADHRSQNAIVAVVLCTCFEERSTKNEANLDELIGYLQAREAWIPNYQPRRIEQKYIGSAHVEKANDVIVARRQKNRGMQ